MFLKRFKEEGFNIDYLIHGIKAKGRPRTPIGSIEIEAKLLSRQCLHNWAHLTILQRCEKIRRMYNVEVKREKLR